MSSGEPRPQCEIQPIRRSSHQALRCLHCYTFLLFRKCAHWRFLSLVNCEAEYVRSRVVANAVKVEFASSNFCAIDLCGKDCFLVEDGTSKHLAKGINDATPTARDDGLWIITVNGNKIGRIVAAASELIARENEATSFHCDVPHRGDPAVTCVGCRCAPNFDALGVHCRTHERHVVLPADDRSQAAVWSFVYRHGGAVAKAPDQTLATRRHQFSACA